MGEKRGMKALEVWCRRVTDGYRDVRVDNMTTAWRDGMAFCALIHHFRPDLLDFDALSKENIYENNNLAFTVAEQHLGIPALLEPEDMVKYAIPDRLSILTYVSQVYQYFASQDGPGKKMSPTKRPLVETTSPSSQAPTEKVASKVMAKEATSPGVGPSSGRGSPSAPTPVPVRHDVCQACQNRVYILERLIVDNKLYHRTCFKCSKCQTVLSPGSYVESDASACRYECVSCPALEKEAHKGRLSRARFPIPHKEPESEQEPETNTVKPFKPPGAFSYTSAKPFSDFISKLTNEESVDAQPPVTDTGQTLADKHKVDDDSDGVESNSDDLDLVPNVIPTETVDDDDEEEEEEEVEEEEHEVKVEVSANDEEVGVVKVVVEEKDDDHHGGGDSSLVSDAEPPPKPSRSPVPGAVSASLQEPFYPDHLNPFGDDDEEEKEVVKQVPVPEVPEVPQVEEKRIGDWILRPRPPQPQHYTQQRRNPFGSGGSQEDLQGDVALRKDQKPVPSPRSSLDPSCKITAPPVKISRKKKPAPSPPRPVTVLVVPSQKDKMQLPKPRPRSVGLVATLNPDGKSQKEMDNRNLKTPSDNLSQSSTSPTSPRNRNTFGYWKKKKPAPPVPLPPKRQIRKIPLKEIFMELEEIEERQLELERKGVEIEKSIRERFSNTSDPSTEEEDLILHLFELVNKKNGLFRRQAELIYMKRQQRLEEEHADLEFQIRCLMEKSAHKKTDAERIFEEQLIERLVEVVKQRNEIVESMEIDRLREREEDESIQEKMALHQTLGTRRSSIGSGGSSAASSSQSPASSEKSSKKDKKEKQVKGGNKKGSTNIDADKDIDESESLPQVKAKKDKKKKWF